MSGYSCEERAMLFSLKYRVFLKYEKGQYISPFHDIPMYSDKDVFHMVVEVPRWPNAKMEIATKDPLTPIKPDVKKGKLRYVANLFPYKGCIWNDGAIPQTWEDRGHNDKHTGFCGDNDLIDVCEIGSKVCARGEIIGVKVLGILAMIDPGKTDWKVTAIHVEDPDAVDIKSTHDYWKALVTKKTDGKGISCMNTTVTESPFKCDPGAAKTIVDALPPPCKSACTVPTDVDTWFHNQKN
ncbi:inorganic pyrophosphatase [Tupaia chinensis]|uniref:inorganic diphosphatase n=1 Tax=Tupaia chinensis TaxID=246437 RepID=L9L2L9_TUPCH|nr:inorganic pyrophosphatase [Tupaia chinensis]ELW69430.1 Inorganic pyrophosphatase [Tupaia chinensis]